MAEKGVSFSLEAGKGREKGGGGPEDLTWYSLPSFHMALDPEPRLGEAGEFIRFALRAGPGE